MWGHDRLKRGRASMSSVSPDQELISRAVAGDRVALERLLLSCHDRLSRHIRRHFPDELRGLIDIEDVLHKTYVKAFRAIGTFEARSEQVFYAWLKTIARHQILDDLKRRRRERLAGKRRPARAKDTQGSWVLDLTERVTSDSSTPSNYAVRKETVRAMQIALATLSEDHRRAVYLRYLRGLSLEEAAKRMSRSKGAVRGLCYRAKRELREVLGRASSYSIR